MYLQISRKFRVSAENIHGNVPTNAVVVIVWYGGMDIRCSFAPGDYRYMKVVNMVQVTTPTTPPEAPSASTGEAFGCRGIVRGVGVFWQKGYNFCWNGDAGGALHTHPLQCLYLFMDGRSVRRGCRYGGRVTGWGRVYGGVVVVECAMSGAWWAFWVRMQY